jgi:hypothetical protein
MPFGQSSILTPITLNLTRRIVYTANRCLGKSPQQAAETADELAIPAASAVAAVTAIATLDPAGGALSAGYLALEMGEMERRAQDKRVT